MLRPTNEKTGISSVHLSGFEPETFGSVEGPRTTRKHSVLIGQIAALVRFYTENVCSTTERILSGINGNSQSNTGRLPLFSGKYRPLLFDVSGIDLGRPRRLCNKLCF